MVNQHPGPATRHSISSSGVNSYDMQGSADSVFMRSALEEAHQAARNGNLGVGALVVVGNEVIGRGGNEARSTGDPMAHAEMTALHDAIHHGGRTSLEGAALFTTFEPCPMCLGACLVMGISTILVGGRRPAGDPAWGGYCPDAFADLVAAGGPRIRVLPGPLHQECVAIRDSSLHAATDQMPSTNSDQE